MWANPLTVQPGWGAGLSSEVTGQGLEGTGGPQPGLSFPLPSGRALSPCRAFMWEMRRDST